jgi:uncharacterized OsmC-like protein
MTSMTKTQTMNGVDTARFMETRDAIRAQPSLGRGKFRATSRWINGAHSRATIQGFHVAGEEHPAPVPPHVHEMDEPPVLLGENRGANPVEFVLSALSGCLTTSLVLHAAARGTTIRSVESTLEGDLDMRGFLALDETARNGYQVIRVTFRIDADAPREQIEELVMLAQMRSPVYDTISNPVKVTVALAA